MERLKKLGRVYAAGILKLDRDKELWGEAVSLLLPIGMESKNVEGSPIFYYHQSVKKLQNELSEKTQDLLQIPLPEKALQVGIARFEEAVRQEFQERTR